MVEQSGHKSKTAIMKDIILGLHRGLSIEQAKERFAREIGEVTATEIADMEQSLLAEGMSVDEIKQFCNVHALLFQSALEKVGLEATSPAHPVSLFKAENAEIVKLAAALREGGQKAALAVDFEELVAAKNALADGLSQLRGVTVHYERKEQLLFPYLEKHGFMGPSKVMWGKDNEIRDLLKKAVAGLEAVNDRSSAADYVERLLTPLLEEVDGMVFKEENILLPTSLEKLEPAEWVDILKQSPEIGYVFIPVPEEADVLVKQLQAELEVTTCEEGTIRLPSGSLRLEELRALLDTLPFDLTFVGADDTVRYFTEGRDRIFARPRAVLGRKVQNCHPPQSLDIVQGILDSFRKGEKDFYEFWIQMQGKMIHIRYFAVRDGKGEYLGTLEVTQDITRVKTLEGEKRLIDERD